MGTRGAWGLRYKDEDKITYNHFDSYPDGLGKTIKEFVCVHSVEELTEVFEKIILVDSNIQPTAEQVKETEKWTNMSVSSGDGSWYCLLRESQGEPESYINGLKYMIDNKEFLKDSLFCEYAYIINLDKKVLEFYEGFQKKPSNSRYENNEGEDCGNGTIYYSCKLIAEIPFNELPYIDIENIYPKEKDEKSVIVERKPERIKPILEKIEKIWTKNPDLRLCQLIGNLWVSGDNYYKEDTELENKLNEYYSKDLE